MKKHNCPAKNHTILYDNVLLVTFSTVKWHALRKIFEIIEQSEQSLINTNQNTGIKTIFENRPIVSPQRLSFGADWRAVTFSPLFSVRNRWEKRAVDSGKPHVEKICFESRLV